VGKESALTESSDYEKQLDEAIATLQAKLDALAMRRHKLEQTGILNTINKISDNDVVRKWKPMTEHIRGYKNNEELVIKVSRNLEIMMIIFATQKNIPTQSAQSIVMPLIARCVEYA
jgi:hypothetical protein